MYTCKEGHTLDTGNLVRVCSGEGSLLGFPPICRPIQCDVPVPKPCDNAETDSGSKVAYNEVVTYTCLPGCTLLVGDLSRVCTQEAVLTGTAPRCEEIQCSATLPSPASNVIRESPALVDVGTQAYYSCLQGFTLTDGDLERTCSSDGSLLGNPPVCTETKCDVPQPLQEDNTRRVSAAQVSIGSYAVYECTVGHVVSGQLRMQCQPDGNLGGPLPKCLDGACSVPSPSTDHHVQLVSEPQVPVAADVVYRCNHGYTLQSGNLVRNCQTGGALSGNEPQCVQIRVCEDRRDDCSAVLNGIPNMCSLYGAYSSDCPATCGNCDFNDITCPVTAPSTGDNTVLLNTTTEMFPGQDAVYTCNANTYLVSGNLVRACRLDGSLTREPAYLWSDIRNNVVGQRYADNTSNKSVP
ncbi:sushi, von Willebrand factor type A, EGF and pentraxin domain-containing protein 1-like [Haliotis rubra]|uniref:sushi, von Willebrand factor type A, EGF and pentraxin domain-containing protein 1-like n=1 Tax=Haliotis rubra TaxID=36100 RepID=UPI001EE61BED|nr:sushi, von Willebrand factor type A, EGF and pentraxin domain-containing protein 1-like [Haliotis rubra]